MIDEKFKSDNSNIVSIVICTYKRPQHLKLALDSIMNQHSLASLAELIVVDNEPVANEEVEKMISLIPKEIITHYIHEKQTGLSYARNTGGKIATADYIYYLDDDAQIALDYLEKLTKIINIHQPDICFGPVLPYYDSPKPKWFQDSYEIRAPFEGFCFVNQNKSAPGGNMIIRKEVCEKVGWFDSAFGMTGNKIGYGEETDLQKRAWKLRPNLKSIYAPELYIKHLVKAEKMTLWWKVKSTYIAGYDHAYLWENQKECERGLLSVSFNIVKISNRLLLRIIYRLFCRDRKKHPYWQNFIYELSFAPLGKQLRYLKDWKKACQK